MFLKNDNDINDKWKLFLRNMLSIQSFTYENISFLQYKNNPYRSFHLYEIFTNITEQFLKCVALKSRV